MDNPEILAAWKEHERTRVALNKAINDVFKVGDEVEVLYSEKRGWIRGTVDWVPFENGPAFNHIYVALSHRETCIRLSLGGGVFSNIRKPVA